VQSAAGCESRQGTSEDAVTDREQQQLQVVRRRPLARFWGQYIMDDSQEVRLSQHVHANLCNRAESLNVA
jgi:hypothetical protein